MNFTMVGNQHGLLTTTPVKADGVSPASVTNRTATSSDQTVLTVVQNSGFPDQFIVTAHAEGTATVRVEGRNIDGATVGTDFTFTLTAIPPSPDAAVGFIAELTGVVNN
jgi:hypothetical protein